MKRYTITNNENGLTFATDDERLSLDGHTFETWYPQPEHGRNPTLSVVDDETDPGYAAELRQRRREERITRLHRRLSMQIAQGIRQMRDDGRQIPPAWERVATWLDRIDADEESEQ